MYLIYGLVDPITKYIRYVGRSSTGFSRPKQHAMPCKQKERTHVACWVRSLLKQDLIYDIVKLESVESDAQLSTREMWWIAYGKACGWPLTNLTDGGEGLHGYKMSQITKDKIASAHTGSKRSDSTRKRMSLAQKGKPHTKVKPCGTVAAYERGCRCVICRGANAARRRSQRASKSDGCI